MKKTTKAKNVLLTRKELVTLAAAVRFFNAQRAGFDKPELYSEFPAFNVRPLNSDEIEELHLRLLEEIEPGTGPLEPAPAKQVVAKPKRKGAGK